VAVKVKHFAFLTDNELSD